MKNYQKVFLITLLAPYFLFSLPSNSEVVNGNVNMIQVSSHEVQIQASDRAIINWKDFSINQNEIVQFMQPASNSVVLNRVVSDISSFIDGKLISNGSVYLINQNGITIGPNGIINTASFIASTLNVSNEDFIKNSEMTFKGTNNSQIQNYGKIHTESGDAYLFSYQIKNDGDIESSNGKASLITANEIVLKPETSSCYIQMTIDKKGEDIGIDQNGTITAKNIELQADGNLYALAINHSGSLKNEYSFEQKDGVLLIAKNGKIQNSGEIVSQRDNFGGDIKILAEDITVTNAAHISVTSDNGNGQILIGGDYQGKNLEIYNAKNILVEANALIEANAKTSGNGGKIIFWGDESNRFYGKAEARGGSLSGDGGLIEISSPYNLVYKGLVDTTAIFGNTGTFLLDPLDLIISIAADSNVTGATPFTPTASPANLDTATLIAALAGNNVVVQTTGTIGGEVGNIYVNDPISWTSSNSLTLTAQNTIILNGDISCQSLAINGGDITLSAIDGNIQFIDSKIESIGQADTNGTGGNIALTASNGSIFNDNSVIKAEISSVGATNTTAGQNGGSGGSISLSAGAITLCSNIETIGGNGVVNGGEGGAVTINAANDVINSILDSEIHTIGGNGTTNSGGSGGFINITAGALQLCSVIETIGGDGAISGGNSAGLFVSIAGGVITSSTGILGSNVHSYGGSSIGGSGGNAGNIFIFANPSTMLLNNNPSPGTAFRCIGGNGTNLGGNSGQIFFQLANLNTTEAFSVNSIGGTASSGTGGNTQGILFICGGDITILNDLDILNRGGGGGGNALLNLFIGSNFILNSPNVQIVNEGGSGGGNADITIFSFNNNILVNSPNLSIANHGGSGIGNSGNINFSVNNGDITFVQPNPLGNFSIISDSDQGNAGSIFISASESIITDFQGTNNVIASQSNSGNSGLIGFNAETISINNLIIQSFSNLGLSNDIRFVATNMTVTGTGDITTDGELGNVNFDILGNIVIPLTYNIISANDVTMNGANITLSGLVSSVGVSGNIGLNAQEEIIIASTSNIVSANNITMNGIDITISGAITSSGGVSGNILLTALEDIILNSTSNISSANNLTLVVDANFPTPPLAGPGRFIQLSGSSLSADELRIYTSLFDNNLIQGTLNGSTFSGTKNVEDLNNQYSIYFPGGDYTASDYVVYYKTILNETKQRSLMLTSTMLFMFQYFDPGILWGKDYYLRSDDERYKPVYWTFQKMPFISL